MNTKEKAFHKVLNSKVLTAIVLVSIVIFLFSTLNLARYDLLLALLAQVAVIMLLAAQLIQSRKNMRDFEELSKRTGELIKSLTKKE